MREEYIAGIIESCIRDNDIKVLHCHACRPINFKCIDCTFIRVTVLFTTIRNQEAIFRKTLLLACK